MHLGHFVSAVDCPVGQTSVSARVAGSGSCVADCPEGQTSVYDSVAESASCFADCPADYTLTVGGRCMAEECNVEGCASCGTPNACAHCVDGKLLNTLDECVGEYNYTTTSHNYDH